MNGINFEWDEKRDAALRWMYTIVLLMVYAVSLVFRIREGAIDVIAFISAGSLILYMISLIYAIFRSGSRLILTASAFHALTFILIDMVYIKADFLPRENSSTQWIVASLIALLVFISYFLARILYRKNLLQKKNKPVTYGSALLTSVVAMYFIRFIGDKLTTEQVNVMVILCLIFLFFCYGNGKFCIVIESQTLFKCLGDNDCRSNAIKIEHKISLL